MASDIRRCSHGATVGQVDENQLFYLMSRGLSEEEATAMIVAGFIEPIVKELPMEYAVELNRLIELRWKGRSAEPRLVAPQSSGGPGGALRLRRDVVTTTL